MGDKKFFGSDFMKSKRILLASPHMSEEGYEKEYVKEAFDTNWVAPLGANVNGFEKELAEYVGASHAAALSSGTAAIHLALKAAGVGKDDIVICQSLTFSATANPILYQGAIPVFVDSDYETWNMKPEHLRTALEKYPNTKAVLVVHLYGLSANLDEITKICKEYDVTLIEDAAESLGTTYKGKYTGTFGDYGIYSFNGNKIITTSGGGMLVSNDKEKVEKVRFWATQSREKARHYNWNEPNYWLSVITIKGINANHLIDELDKNNIEARPVWKPMHLQPVFKNYDYIGDDVAETLFDLGVCLPSDTKMTDEDLKYVVSTIKRVINDA